jgi:hypothetical protein
MSGSTNGFCQGDRGAVRTSSMPIASTRSRKAGTYDLSRSRSKLAGCGLPGKGLGHLVRKPDLRGILSHLEMNDFSAVMANYDQCIQDPERRGCHKRTCRSPQASPPRIVFACFLACSAVSVPKRPIVTTRELVERAMAFLSPSIWATECWPISAIPRPTNMIPSALSEPGSADRR